MKRKMFEAGGMAVPLKVSGVAVRERMWVGVRCASGGGGGAGEGDGDRGDGGGSNGNGSGEGGEASADNW